MQVTQRRVITVNMTDVRKNGHQAFLRARDSVTRQLDTEWKRKINGKRIVLNDAAQTLVMVKHAHVRFADERHRWFVTYDTPVTKRSSTIELTDETVEVLV